MALPVLVQDALLYLLAVVFALGTIPLAVSVGYREWAEMSIGPYLIAAGICWFVARRRVRNRTKDSAWGRDRLRSAVMVGLLITVVLIPLAVEVTLTADSRSGAHVQPEVPVIEACGDRVAHHKNCYLSDPRTVGNGQLAQSEDSFFPYLPGMIPFGLINATSGPRELKDARVPLTGFSLLVIAGALLIADTTSRRKWRIFQVVVLLPSGALPMVTGGDDLPVLALLLLGLALATRRKPVWSGVAMGLAGSLKFTAWPLLLLLALGERDSKGRRAILRYAFAAAAIVIPVMGVGVGLSPHAFFLNAIRFPLGLTKVKSPAASPLIGQELLTLFPSAKPELVAMLAVIGLAAVGYGLWRWTPTTLQSATAFCGAALLLATLIAPATRFGYLIYPVDMLTWAVLLRSPAPKLGEELPDAVPVSVTHRG